MRVFKSNLKEIKESTRISVTGQTSLFVCPGCLLCVLRRFICVGGVGCVWFELNLPIQV